MSPTQTIKDIAYAVAGKRVLNAGVQWDFDKIHHLQFLIEVPNEQKAGSAGGRHSLELFHLDFFEPFFLS